MTTAAPRRPAPRGWAFSRLGFVRRVFVGAYEDNIPFLASALTFDALLWLLPFVLLAASVFGYIVGTSDVPLADVRTLIARFLPEHGAALIVTGNTLTGVLVLQSPWLGQFLAGVSTFAFGVVLFYIVYRVAPARRVRWDTALVAAVAASLWFELAKRLYTAYLGEFATFDRVISNSNAIALLLFVLWVYYTCFVFLAASELAETYDLVRRQREQRALLT